MAGGEFAKARQQCIEYFAGLERRLRTGTLDRRALAEARDLVEWSRSVVVAARAQAIHELEERRGACAVARAYRTTG